MGAGGVAGYVPGSPDIFANYHLRFFIGVIFGATGSMTYGEDWDIYIKLLNRGGVITLFQFETYLSVCKSFG